MIYPEGVMSERQQAYRRLFARVQSELPRDATPRQRGEAARRAAAIWRGRQVRSNPDGGGLMRLAIYGAVLYFAVKALQRQNQNRGG